MPPWQSKHRGTLTPYIAVNGIDGVMDFVRHVFDGEVVGTVLRHADGTVWNAHMRIGDSQIMLAEARGFGPHPAFLYTYVPNCDAAYAKALEAGAEGLMPPSDQFYGDRNAGVRDPAGNVWWLATHLEEVPADELHRRAAAHEAAKVKG